MLEIHTRETELCEVMDSIMMPYLQLKEQFCSACLSKNSTIVLLNNRVQEPLQACY